MANNRLTISIIICLAVALGAWLPFTASAVVEGAIERDEDSSSFDHLGTGYALVGAHASLDCKSCHVEGIFEDLATQCADCHDGGIAIGMSANHPPVTDSCDTCHNMESFEVSTSTTMDHSVLENMVCSECHDGVTATGKHATHVETLQECNACHNVNTWSGAGFDHRFVGDQACVSCHNGTDATGKTATHIATTDLCDACHTTDAWLPIISVNHTQVTGVCSSCHDGTTATGKGINHIPTEEQCNACHTVEAWTATFDHSRLTSSQACIDCHNGAIATGKADTHISTSDQCNACHTTTDWVVEPSAVDHAQVIGTCSSCHNGTIATGKNDTHIDTTAECDTCHTADAWLPAAVDHSGFQNNCFDCHNGTNASGKGDTHINTSDACNACHEVFPATWIPVAPASVDHAQIVGNCIDCHNGSIASGKSDTHISSSNNCNTCHAVGPTPWQPVLPADVDHNEVTGVCSDCHDGTIASGKNDTHINSSDNCNACHAPGPTPWQPVLPADVDHNEVIGVCSACHDGAIATGKSDTHIDTTAECDTCHTVDAWTPATVDHTDYAPGTCIDCHDGTTASGKTTSHIDTSNICDACHERFPANWQPVAPASVDHAQVNGTCISCHDGTTASGKGTSHISSSDVCEACHAPGPTPWQPVEPANVDHNEVIGVCSSCHDGTIATGQDTDHISTTDNCDTCHTVGSWLPAAVDHSSFANNCIDCHNGTNASGKSNTHINSSDQCDSCHAVFPATWAPVQPASVDHTQVTGTCISCHDGTIASGKSNTHITSSDNCDACHAPGPTPWQPVLPADVDHNEVTGTCASCHDGTIASGKSNAHINTTDVCEACHAPGPTPWQPVLPANVDHNEVIGTCSSCHDGTIAIGKPTDHIPTTEECDVCHTVGAWLPAAVDHSGFANNCIDCHNGTDASGKSNTHINSTDSCDACHAPFPATWIPVAPASVDHAQVTGTCISCHDGTIASGKSNTHISSSDNCDACHAPGPTPWQPIAPADVDHNEVIGTCSSCHDGSIATGQDADHINTSDECDTCHAVGSWLPATVDHTGFANNCIDCHNGTNASGKSNTHINSSDQCDSCHAVFPATWAPVAPTDVDHAQVIGTCISCHDGTTAVGKSNTHITSSDNCDACHAPGPTPWQPVAPADVDHNEVTGTCASCHDGTIAIGKPTNHIQTTDECDVCHTVGAWLPAAVDHSGFAGNCIDCHNGTDASGKSNTHISSSDSCDACHATFPATWAPVAPANVDHTQVIGTCISCHDGTTAIGKSNTHITSSDNCDACHAPGPTPWQPVAPADVDHNEVTGSCASCHDGTIASGKSNTHITTSDNCDACHAPGPTPWQPVAPADVDHNEVTGTCASCHDGTIAIGKSNTHINTTDVCEACHAPGPTPWQPVLPANVDHNEVIGVCSSCHDGSIAIGKPTNHISTTEECDVCHTVGAWLPAAVDHSGFLNNCIDCHNGTDASGKTNTHISSSDQCDSCHAVFPATWAPVAPANVDHAQVVGTCVSCHDGTTAIGKSNTHISSSDNCDACHAPGPTPWQPVAPADVDHNEVTGSCASCHDGTTATGKSNTHITTTDACETCHAVAPTPWLPVAPADVDHNQVLGTCASCHNGTTAVGKSNTHINSSDNCDACHAPGPTPWQPVLPADVDHNEVIGTCSSCHDGTIAIGKPTDHIPTTDECGVCHTVGAWLPAAVDHTNFANNCIDCHNGTDASGKSNTHISSSDTCDACHAPFPATWAPVAPTNVDHAQVIGTCISCHDGTTAIGKSNTHITSSDNCDACHAPSPTPWQPVAPADVDHNEVTGTCASCHDGSIAIGKSNTHISSTDVCEACHAPGPTPWAPAVSVDHDQVLGSCSTCHDGVIATGVDPGHVQTTEECDVCHLTTAWLPATVDHGNYVNNCARCHDGVSASGKSNTHLNTSDECELCHAVHPATWSPVAPANVDHTQVIGTCVSCHDGTSATGKSNTHINSSDNCDACHAAGPTPWQPVLAANVDHNEVIGTCSSCHDGNIAIGKPTDHIQTTDECDVCHTVGAWLPAGVDHTGFANNCITCHNGTDASGKSNTHISSTDSCDACHATFPATWAPVAADAVDHNQVTGTCISCHDGTTAIGKSNTHIASSDNCDACHAPGPTPWAPVAPANVDHNEIIGSCISCHDGTTATGKSNTHISTTDVCDACHAVAPTPWQPVANADVDHNQVLGTCESCHDGSTAIGKSNTHINSTNNCAACHAASPTPWTSIITVDHNEVLGSCSTCHDGTTAIGKPNGHVQTTAECDTCHNVGAWLPAGVDHSGFVNNCIDCHNNTDASGKPNNHINTTDLCDACHEVMPATWAPVASSAVDHNQVIGTCVSCHDGNTAIGKGTAHINTTDVCDACHAPGPTPWTPVQASAVDHNEVIGSCISCHDGSTAIGKSATHINTTDLCEACHLPGPTPWSPAASVDHNEVLGSCSTCHDGVTATGFDPGHVQTTEECDACHSTTGWLPATVDHRNFNNNCVRCHDGVDASGKTAAHLNTSDVCEACHEKHPANWTPVPSVNVDHSEVIGTCVSCHNGTDAIGKGTTHIESTDNCAACHEPGPIPWIQVAPSNVDHNEILGACISCHDGSIASGKSNTHINSSDNCDTCHAVAPTPWAPVASSDVDHNEVIGTCISCHNGTDATGQSNTHISTTDACDACHATGSPWIPVAPSNVDHSQVLGTCASCHNNVSAVGKSNTHINSSDNCDACHAPAPTPWSPLAPSSVDHNEVIGVCESCHDGVIAQGKPGDHPNTTDNCGACHAPAPTPWASVTTVDHNEVLGTCSVCHDNVTATGKPNNHIQTTAECNACHTTNAWLPAGVDHSGFVNNCIDCHDGTTATGKSSNHPSTTDLCDACHQVFPASWAPVQSVDHTQVLGSCASCHNGVDATGPSNQHIATTDNCAACHQPAPTPWIPVAAQNVDHNEVLGTCVSCHDNSTAPGMPGDHPTTTNNCDACHNPVPSRWSTWTVDHTEVTGCESCHDGGVARGKPGDHCPTTQDCDFCHRTDSWNEFRDC